MASFSRRLLTCLLVLAALAATLAAQQLNQTGGKVLVLRNGRVLRGDLTRLGERAILVLDNGGQVQLPARDIAVEAGSLEEAFEQLRQSLVAPDKASSHLDLASWCIQEGLYKQAGDELLKALDIDAQNPRIDELHRQLTFLTSARPEPKSKPSSEPAENPSQVGPKQLDELARSLPDAVVEQFTGSVQLVLIQRCAATGCHDAASRTAFRLLRPLRGESFWRSMTLRNLHATHEQVDKAHPRQSPLLTMATTAHGASPTAPLEKQPEALSSLIAWLDQLGSTTAAAGPDAPGATQEPRPIDPNTTARPLTSASEAEPAVAPEDPFDPAEFNQQFAKPIE